MQPGVRRSSRQQAQAQPVTQQTARRHRLVCTVTTQRMSAAWGTNGHYLLDGWPAGHGALAVDTPPKDWRCPLCRKRAKGRHHYPFAAVCTACAVAAIRRLYVACPLVATAERVTPLGQGTLW